MFGPKHTVASVAKTLIEGLSDGSIVLEHNPKTDDRSHNNSTMESTENKEQSDTTDVRIKYEPCPKCESEFDMGLVLHNGKLAVECMHFGGDGRQCDFRGPEVAGDVGIDQDKAALDSWNSICRACYRKRLHTEHDWTKHPFVRHGKLMQFINNGMEGYTSEELYAHVKKERERAAAKKA